MSPPAVLEARNLSKSYQLGASTFGFGSRTIRLDAVKAVSFRIARGETFGIVGESGSGKSTTARLLMRLIRPTSGEITLNGESLLGLSAEDLRLRRRSIQMVFQDPFASLNPRLTVGYQLSEPLIVHGLASGSQTRGRIAHLLERVGLRPDRVHAYPHEFSGGERQRIAIARALAVEPDVIVADEAVSALDVSVRAQILNLLEDVKAETRLAMLFISHDLGVVRHIADRVAVMYRGRIVEIGPTGDIFRQPRHPYTLELLEAIPVSAAGARRRVRQHPTSVAAAQPKTGCPYAPRCALALDACRQSEPPLEEAGPGRSSACFRAETVPAPAPVERGSDPASRERLRRLQRHFLSMGSDEVAV